MTFYTGLRSGLRSGIRSGLNPDEVVGGLAGVTRDSTSLVYSPADAGEWTILMAAAALATGNPASAWPFQQASGNAVDGISGINLTPANWSLYQQAVPGWTRLCVRGIDSTANSSFTNTTTAPNASLTSTLLLAYCDIPAAPGAIRDVLCMGNNTDVRYNTNGKLRLVAGASADLVSVAASTVQPVVLRVNLTASTITVFTLQEKFLGTFAAPQNTIRVSFGGIFSPVPAIGYLYGAQFTGAAAELSDAQVKTLLQALGWTITAWS